MEKSTSKNKVKNLNTERERKPKLKSKFRLIYDSKLKFNLIGREIRRETRILTQDSTRNDPINRRIKGFSFRNFKDDRQHSRSEFSLFSPRNLTFKYSLDVKIDLEDEESKRFKD